MTDLSKLHCREGGDRTNGHECHGSTSYHFDVVLLSDWFLPTIFEFLDIPDIVKMDSIMLKIKKFVRNDFGTLPVRIQKYLYTDESIEWCVKRNISFKNLDLAIHSGVINRKNFSITTKGVSQLAKLCIELKDLQLFSFSAAGCPNIWLQEIAKYSKQLRFLSILGSVTISDEALTGTNIYHNPGRGRMVVLMYSICCYSSSYKYYVCCTHIILGMYVLTYIVIMTVW